MSCGVYVALFLLLQKSYETKQYKKGLKAADAILKKFPDHGGILLFGNSLFMLLPVQAFYFFRSCFIESYSKCNVSSPLSKIQFLLLLLLIFICSIFCSFGYILFLFMCLFPLLDRNFIDEGFDIKLHGS